MADLRTRFATLDRLPAPDLWAEVERRAMAAGDPTKVSAAQPTWRGPVPSATNQRLVLALVLLALLAIAVLGAAIAGGLLRDPLRGLVPTVDADASAKPSEAVETQVLTEPFTSELYGYSVRYPEGWEVSPAADAWVGFGSRDPSVTDVVQERALPGSRFAVVAGPLAIGLQDDLFTDEWRQGWIDTAVPPPPELRLAGERRSCDFAAVRGGPEVPPNLPEATVVAEDLTIGGLRAQMHAICGHVDAVVWGEGRVFILSLVTPGRVDGDVALFNFFAQTFKVIDVADVQTTPSPTATVSPTPTPDPVALETFRSNLYGYAITHPASWTASFAQRSWIGARPWGQTEGDAIVGPDGQRLDIAAQPVAVGMNEATWRETYVPWPAALERQGADEGFCAKGHTRMPVSSTTWQWRETTIGGQRASLRELCGQVDGVVIIGDHAWVLSLATTEIRPDGDQALFMTLADTMEFAAGPPTKTLISDIYAHRISYPPDWIATPASKPWTGDAPWTVGSADVITTPRSNPTPRFTLVARAVPDHMSDAAWIEAFVRLPEGASSSGCTFRGPGIVWTGTTAAAEWSATVIDGLPAQVRALCGYVQAVLFFHGWAHVLTLETGLHRGDGDLQMFRMFADGFSLDR